jgi:hypothetical protein
MLEIRETHHMTRRSSLTPSRALQAAFATTNSILYGFTRKLRDV